MSDSVFIGGDGRVTASTRGVRRWAATGAAPPAENIYDLRARAVEKVGRVQVRKTIGNPHRATLRFLECTADPAADLFDHRRLRVIDAIVKAAERAGASPRGPVGADWIEVAIGRRTVAFRVGREASGEPGAPLWFEIRGHAVVWRDSCGDRLELHLPEIVAELFVVATLPA